VLTDCTTPTVGHTGSPSPPFRSEQDKRLSLPPTGGIGLHPRGHVAFTVDTGVQVYFCDPRSPWQRATSENTNGLLRQYFPKGSDLSVHHQAHIDAVARQLNSRARQALDWMKPSEALTAAVAMTA
jgi:IS30 family transposase